jgi:hypothetical protein
LARRQKLGRTAPENYAYWQQEFVRRSLSVDPLRIPNWKEELDALHSGELVDLLDGDYLPVLLRSEEFAAALKQSGRSLNEVLAEVRAVTEPSRRGTATLDRSRCMDDCGC